MLSSYLLILLYELSIYTSIVNNNTGLLCTNTTKLNFLKKRNLQHKDENIICKKRSKTDEHHKTSENQEDCEFLSNLENDKNLLNNIKEEYQDGRKCIQYHDYVLYCYNENSIWNNIFIFISIILNNLIGIFKISNIEKVICERDSVQDILYLNSKQILYCFWAINTYSKDKFQIRNLKMKEPVIKPRNLTHLIYFLKNDKSDGKNIFKCKKELNEYDLKSKIEYLLMNLKNLKKYRSLFNESILILLFCYNIPEDFYLKYKIYIIDNFVVRLIYLTEAIKRTKINKLDTIFTKNLEILIKIYCENFCNYRLSSKSKLKLNTFKCNIIKKIQNVNFYGSISILKYWNIFSLLRGIRIQLSIHVRTLESNHSNYSTKYQDFMIHFLIRINELLDKVL